jgi:5'-methylthioadenosine phosphorylase
MALPLVGVIGGSGLYQMTGIADVREVEIKTPFGKPSDRLIRGRLGDVELIFLPRHGKGHRWLPTEINFRANIFALKKLGVERIISVSAVGSLREEIEPGHLVVPDQFIDRTSQRRSTFFGRGLVAHVGLADPFCEDLSAVLIEAARAEGAKVHPGGTYVCMEGPQFSTRAESRLYRSWGAHVIGMTNLQEAKLAREAEIAYATMALVTDYDCWHPDHDSVTIDMIIGYLTANVKMAQEVIAKVVERLDVNHRDPAHSALRSAILTHAEAIPAGIKRDLAPLIGKYVK